MNQTITRTLATAFAMTAVAVGLPGLAQADPPLLNGTYTSDGDADQFLWTIATNCGGNGCTGSVASNQGWTVPAILTGGRWEFTVTKPDGVICDDGRYAPAYISLSVDPVTLEWNAVQRLQLQLPGRRYQPVPVHAEKGRLSPPRRLALTRRASPAGNTETLDRAAHP